MDGQTTRTRGIWDTIQRSHSALNQKSDGQNNKQTSMNKPSKYLLAMGVKQGFRGNGKWSSVRSEVAAVNARSYACPRDRQEL